MSDYKHTVLCVDDEEGVLNSIRRLLRREGYRLLTASSGKEGLKVLDENDVHMVISDQRMPQMSGTEFLAIASERYPDVFRVILTGYTDVDSITESINKGQVYKFFLKPWNDQNLKLEIRQALEQHDLIQANKELHEEILRQNEALKTMNENLEKLVQERTKELEIQNQALELSHEILEYLPVPIIGISAEGVIVLTNRQANNLPFFDGSMMGVGKEFTDYFPDVVEEKMTVALATNKSQTLKDLSLSGVTCDLDLIPLSGRFSGRGVILVVYLVSC